MNTIDQMWAFIATDEDGEGVSAFMSNDIWMPMVAADEARVDSLRDMAKQLAQQSGQSITLAKFSVREDLEVFEP